MADFSCQLVSQAVWHGFSRKKNDLLRQARQKTYNNKKQYYIMNIKPLADRVLILPAPAEEKDNRWHHHPRYSKKKNRCKVKL